MTNKWPIDPALFDGEKFAARYKLRREDFHAVRENGQLYLEVSTTITLPQDPPIFEAPDSPDDAKKKAALEQQAATDAQATSTRALLLETLNALNEVRAKLAPPLPRIKEKDFDEAVRGRIRSGEAATPPKA